MVFWDAFIIFSFGFRRTPRGVRELIVRAGAPTALQRTSNRHADRLRREVFFAAVRAS
jgi:hypothetical protein